MGSGIEVVMVRTCGLGPGKIEGIGPGSEARLITGTGKINYRPAKGNFGQGHGHFFPGF
jgi:hypothetical protein